MGRTACTEPKYLDKGALYFYLYLYGTEGHKTAATVILETLPNKTHIFLNPLNPELNPICYLLALLGAHHFLHLSRIRV